MKRTLFLCLALLACSITVYSQTMLIMAKPKDSKLWGYANLKGEMVIPAQFEKCHPFSPEGLAVIYNSKEKQFYFINTKGEKLNTEVTSFKLKDNMFSGLDGFSDGLIQIKIGEKWGYLNTAGKIGIQAKYEETSMFNEGFAIVKSGGNYLVIDTHGKETTISGTGILDIKPFKEKLAPYRAADKKMGFIGIDGKIAIEAKFESVGYFTNGLAWAKTLEKTVGFINPKGEWVIQPTFESANEFDTESGMAKVKKNDKTMFVDKEGKTLEITIAESFGTFSEGLADGKSAKQVGFFNNKGTWVIKPQFEAIRDFKNGYAAAKQGEQWGIIDRQGGWVIKPAFEGIRDVEVVK